MTWKLITANWNFISIWIEWKILYEMGLMVPVHWAQRGLIMTSRKKFWNHKMGCWNIHISVNAYRWQPGSKTNLVALAQWMEAIAELKACHSYIVSVLLIVNEGACGQSATNWTWWHDIDGLVQERSNSCVLAMELHLSCTNPSIWNCFMHYWPLCEGNPLSLVDSPHKGWVMQSGGYFFYF